jgi:hypothetical protein
MNFPIFKRIQINIFQLYPHMYNVYENWYKRKFCRHTVYNCDKQIRVLKCTCCGKMAWIGEYVDLYPNKRK